MDPFEQRNLFEEDSRLGVLMYQQLARFAPASADPDRQSASVPADLASRLTTLGYVGSGTATSTARAGEGWPDPKDRIREYNAFVQERLERGVADHAGCSVHAQ
jgi:hypothetical protein